MLLREDTAARSRLGFLSLDITRSRLCFRPKESVPTTDLGATTSPAKSCSRSRVFATGFRTDASLCSLLSHHPRRRQQRRLSCESVT
jgi:hypothetical protein